MKIETWSVGIGRSFVTKVQAGVEFVWRLIGSEASVSVNPEQGATRGSGVGLKVSTDFPKRFFELGDEI